MDSVDVQRVDGVTKWSESSRKRRIRERIDEEVNVPRWTSRGGRGERLTERVAVSGLRRVLQSFPEEFRPGNEAVQGRGGPRATGVEQRYAPRRRQ